MTAKVSIRLGTEGKAQVNADFREIGDSGDAAARRWQRAFDRAGQDVEASMRQQSNAAAKLAAILPQTSTQRAYQAGASTNYSGQSARESAAVFREVAAMEAQLEARTRSLLSAIDPAWAAQQRLNAGLAEAKSLYDAGSISAARYTEVVRQMTGAKAADAALGAGPGNSAAASAAVFEQAFQQMENRAHALRAAIDPAYAAQSRFNSEIAEARTLVAAGAISLDTYCDKLRLERQLLDQATQAQMRNGVSVGQMNAGVQQLGYNFGDFWTQIGMGAPVMQAFMAQFAQSIGAISLMTNKTTGLMGVLGGPWGQVIAAGGIVLAMLTQHLFSAGDASDDLSARQSALADELDRTTGKVKEQVTWLAILAGAKEAEAKAKTAGNAYYAARDRLKAEGASAGMMFAATDDGGHWRDTVSQQGRAYINAQLARYNGGYGGGINAETLVRNLQAAAKNDPSMRRAVDTIRSLAFEVDKASTASGDMQLKLARSAVAAGIATDAQKRFVAARTEGVSTDKSLIDARAKLAGATTAADRAQATYNISIIEADKAFEKSRKTEADKAQLLAARTDAEHKLNLAQDANRKTNDRHAVSLQRNAEAMEVNADGAFDLARAYLESGSAALRAEAARKALTDATRKGIDGEAQTRRQLAIMLGDIAVAGAKQVDQLRSESDAREAANDNLLKGVLGYQQLEDALQREASLRPLRIALLEAEGKEAKDLTNTIAALTAEIERNNAARANSAAILSIARTKGDAADIRAATADMMLDPLTRAQNAASRDAAREAKDGKFSPERAAELDLERQGKARAEFFDRMYQDGTRFRRDYEDRVTLQGRELELLRASDTLRESELRKTEFIVDWRRKYGLEGEKTLTSQLQLIDAMDVQQQKLDLLRDSWSEVTEIGGNFIDTVLDPRGWNDWGDLGKRVLADLQADFSRLAAINPLKNMLFGSNLPTLGSLGRLFGGAKAPGAAGSFAASLVGANAAGTERWGGGWTMLGENGPELGWLPEGSKVRPFGETRRLLGSNDAGPPVNVSINIDARGADADGLARVEAEVRDLKETLPQKVIEVWTEARDRMVIR